MLGQDFTKSFAPALRLPHGDGSYLIVASLSLSMAAFRRVSQHLVGTTTVKDRNYRTAWSSTLNLRGRCPGAGAARITQPLWDKVPFAPPELFNYD